MERFLAADLWGGARWAISRGAAACRPPLSTLPA